MELAFFIALRVLLRFPRSRNTTFSRRVPRTQPRVLGLEMGAWGGESRVLAVLRCFLRCCVRFRVLRSVCVLRSLRTLRSFLRS